MDLLLDLTESCETSDPSAERGFLKAATWDKPSSNWLVRPFFGRIPCTLKMLMGDHGTQLQGGSDFLSRNRNS